MRTVCAGVVVLMLSAGAAAQEIDPLARTDRESGARARVAASREAVAGAGRLADLLAELERANPGLAARRRDVDMRVARIAPAGAPPDPVMTIGYMGGLGALTRPFFPSASAAGSYSYQEFAATQEVPYPGKLALRTQIAAAEADEARWDYEDVRVMLAAELKTAYVEYVSVDRRRAIVEQFKTLLEQIRSVAEAQFAVGLGAQQDVLKAQLEISMLLERQAMLEQERVARRARINALLSRPPDAPLEARLAFEVGALSEGLEELRARVAERYPAARRDAHRIDRREQALALARKEVLPDFAVSFTSQRPAGMPWMYGVDLMVRLPIFWQRKQRPMIAEATAALEGDRRMRERTLAMAAAELSEAYAMAETSRRLMTLYDDSILPQARLALESSLAAYQVGRVDFLTLLTNSVTVLTAELGHVQQTAEYRKALARLEPLTRLELIK